MKITSKKIVGETKRFLSFELIIGILSSVLIWVMSVYIWYGIYVMKIIGQMDAERVSGLFKIAGKMLRDAPIVFILITILSLVLGFAIGALARKRKRIPDKRGDIISPKSRRRPMDNEELKTVFELRDEKDLEGLILGVDEETGLIITLPDKPIDYNKAPTNEMLIGFGPSGTRKTSGIILPNIYQFLKEGRPLCITDPKGEIYRDTVAAARYYGYKIHILNIITNRGEHSDGVDILKPIRDASDEEANALIQMIRNVILANTGDGKQDLFWKRSAENFLDFILTLVTRVASFKQTYTVTSGGNKYSKRFPENGAGEFRTFYTLYELLKLSDEDLINLVEQTIDEKDMDKIRGAYVNWKGNSQHGQIKVSLATQLNIFNNPTLCKILSEPEIDLDRIATEKAVIYLECPDGPSPQACVLSMFTTMLFHKLETYVDVERRGKGLDKSYTVIFEEFPNIGRIPDVSRYLATFRSRKITLMMFFQDLSQMKDLYSTPERPLEWEAMLDNCSIKLLLGTGDVPTAERFEKLCGNMTVIEQSQRRTRNIFTRFLSSAEETQTITERERPVYSASELLGDMFPVNKILILVTQHNPLMAEKYYSKRHPLYRLRFEADDGGVLEDVDPTIHIPAWRLRELSSQRNQIVGRGYDPGEKVMRIRYFENYDLPEEIPEEEKEENRFKKVIEHILFEDEPEIKKRKRVVSKRSFKDFEREDEVPLQSLVKELTEDREEDIDENEGYDAALGDIDERDKKASAVFDDYDW